MKRLHLLCLVLLLTGTFASAEEKPKGDGDSAAKKSAATKVEDYETGEQIKAMPACRATPIHNGVCVFTFKTADGKLFYIGSPGATEEVEHFLHSLEIGKAYDLPGAFLEWQKKQEK
jgi:hypothetical protein